MKATLTVIAFFHFGFLSDGLRCFQGQRVLQGQAVLRDWMESRECEDSSHICHRYDITGTTNRASGK